MARVGFPPRLVSYGLALAVVVSVALAPVAPAQTRSLAGVSFGPTDVARVPLKPIKAGWIGRLNLLVRNRSVQTGRLRLRFFPAHAARAVNLGSDRNSGGFVSKV